MKLNPNGLLTKWDLLYFNNQDFDFFIVDDPNLYDKKEVNLVSAKEALEYHTDIMCINQRVQHNVRTILQKHRRHTPQGSRVLQRA
jgi:hypothetical protein